MPTIAIVGAGPGLGIATALKFGREGFSVALIARSQDKLDRLCSSIEAEGVTAGGYTADVQDADALRQALTSAADALGTIEVLQYSPVPRKEFLRSVLDTSVADLVAATEFSILGPVAAVQQVLPGMTELGRGTILFVNGASAATPNGAVAGTSIAFAGESAYGTMLHEALKPKDIHVAQLIIPGAIGGGDPAYAPDVLADTLWALHTERGDYRRTIGG